MFDLKSSFDYFAKRKNMIKSFPDFFFGLEKVASHPIFREQKSNKLLQLNEQRNINFSYKLSLDYTIQNKQI